MGRKAVESGKWHIQARLSKSKPQECDAVEIFDGWVRSGRTPRDLIVALILEYSGKTPADYTQALDMRLDGIEDRLTSKLDELIHRLESNVGDMLKHLKRTDPQGLRRFAEADTDEDDTDLDETFIQNAQKSVRKTFQQRQAEKHGRG